MLFMSCDCHAFASVHCCLVVTCWERADLLALVCDVYCGFVTFPCGILGQVWYLIVLIRIFAVFLTLTIQTFHLKCHLCNKIIKNFPARSLVGFLNN